jgi:hypothetical protein
MESNKKSAFEQYQKKLREAERRIAEHPGYREHLKIEALNRSLNSVFIPNWKELLALLDAAATNEMLATELVQNVRKPTIRDRFDAALTQRLHNYLAGAQSLVDHVRRLMRNRSGSIAEEFTRRKQELLQNPEVPFMEDFRNFVLHRELPYISHSISMGRIGTALRMTKSEVELGVWQLLKWEKWKPLAREFLKAQGNVLILRPVIKKHGQLMIGLNGWLHNELAKANKQALIEVNKLVDARNSIQRGDPEK